MLDLISVHVGFVVVEPGDIAEARLKLEAIDSAKAAHAAAIDTATADIAVAEVSAANAQHTNDRPAALKAAETKVRAERVMSEAHDAIKLANLEREIYQAKLLDYDKRLREADELRRRLEAARMYAPLIREAFDLGERLRATRTDAAALSGEGPCVLLAELCKMLQRGGSRMTVNAQAVIDNIPRWQAALRRMVEGLR
jgi:hypothetical protein